MAGFDPMSIFNLATSQSSNYWIALGINTILSTIIGGIVLIVLVEVFSHKFGESIKPQNAFLVVLLANVANNFGVIGLLGGFLSGIPYLIMVLPFLVWLRDICLLEPDSIKGLRSSLNFHLACCRELCRSDL
jgi:fatty acid desaturase